MKKFVARGVMKYSTPGHGGYHLSKTRNVQVDVAWRDAGGWYEEDCKYAIVVFTFPELYTAAQLRDARASLKTWFPDAFTKVTGETVTPEESHVLRERIAREAASDRYIAVSAFGAWHHKVPADMVAVYAIRGGRLESGHYASVDRGWFLVTSAEYDTRGPIGFVVDESKHARIEALQ